MRRDLSMRSSKLFKATYSQGKSVSDRVLRLYFYRDGNTDKQIGFSVSKKVGKAVARNRIKRRLREIIAGEEKRIRPGSLLIFVARPPAAGISFNELRASALGLLEASGALRTDVDKKTD